MIYMSPLYFLSSFDSTDLLVQKFKMDFQDGGCGCHLRVPIRMILAIFDLQVPPNLMIRTISAGFDLQVASILPTKLCFNWPFSSEEVQNRFQDGH